MGRRHFNGEGSVRGAQTIAAVVGSQMRDRQRHAAEVQRKRYHRGENPTAPRGFLFEFRHRCPPSRLCRFGGLRRRRRNSLQAQPA